MPEQQWVKYTDRDATDDELRKLAIRYVLSYKGSFQPILDCYTRLLLAGDLDVAHVRLVLNTMRSDPNVIGMPEPQPIASVIKMPDRRPRKHPQAVVRARPVVLHRKMTVKLPYGHSVGVRNASVIHVVDPNSYMIWYLPMLPGTHDRDWSAARVPEPAIRYLCSPYTGPAIRYLRLLNEEQAQELIKNGERHWCAICQRKQHAQT